jgi:hypothetical protein
MAEGSEDQQPKLTYEDKLAIAEECFQVMLEPEFKLQVNAFTLGLAATWEDYRGLKPLVDQEILRLVTNMIQFGIVHQRGLKLEDLTLTPEQIERYERDSLAYRQEVKRKAILDSIPMVENEHYQEPRN